MCHWNLNNVVLHNFAKIQSLIAYNCIHKFEIICLSESYLNSEILSSGINYKYSVSILHGWIILQIQNAEVRVGALLQTFIASEIHRRILPSRMY